jgi:hypothetical protein
MRDFKINRLKGIFFMRDIDGVKYFYPCGLSFFDKLWWRFMPGVIINVKWPSGDIIVDHTDPRWKDMGGAVRVNLGFSADPNEHYRPWLEKHVGKQGWNWQWGMGGHDATDNRLTIKIRKKHAQYATIAAMMWL